MNTLDAVVERLVSLRSKARTKLGQNDLDLTQAVDLLIAGYGTADDCPHTETTWRYISDNNGGHTHTEVCTTCGKFVSLGVRAKCTSVAPRKIAKSAGTMHTTTTICGLCDYVYPESSTTEGHIATLGRTNCVVCGALI